MIYRIAMAAGIGLYLLGAQTAPAQPMRCSGEQKTCVANCQKNPDRAAASACMKNCYASQSICMRTGCWDNGRSRYCGLLRQ